MPAVTIMYPVGFFDKVNKKDFKDYVKLSVALHMDAVSPTTGVLTEFYKAPSGFIDLVLMPYAVDDADVTALLLGTVVSYDWPDRMVNIYDRMEAITNDVRKLIPQELIPAGMDGTSFTFLGKPPGAWCAA